MVLKQLFGKKGETSKTGAHVPPVAEDTARTGAHATSGQGDEAAEEGVQAGNPNEPSAAVHLEQAMIENARDDNGDTRRKVYQELLFSDLLLALADTEQENSSADTTTAAQDGSNMSVAILSNSAGVQFAACFTSPSAARRWRTEGGQYVSVRGQDIFKLLEPSPAEVIVINPGSAPFIVLQKVEFRQLAMGIVPQSGPSPVQVAAGAPTQGEEAAQGGDGQMQVAFPPDVFNDEQKDEARAVMSANASIEAAVLGAILPPGAGEGGWIRTVFLRVNEVPEDQEAMQNFCVEVRKAILQNEELFKDINFEVGVMPDPNFWIAMHQNNIVLFDKNPPALPKAEGKEGVVDASV